MALPVGVTTATCTVGVPVSFTGAANIRANVSVKPSVFLVHAATGTPLVDMLETIDTTDGVAGQFTLPHTDQAGFVDENQNVYTNWYYTVTIQYSNDRQVMLPKPKVFQLTTGQTLVDLDQLPSGVPALPYTAPSATVSAFGGRTGAVTLQESDLPQRLQVGDLSATYALKGEASRTVPVFVFVGESNSGGQAPLSSLTAAEKLARPAVQILNNTTLLWENLHIGVNNNIGHTNLAPNTTHGWEAGLATEAEAAKYMTAKPYLIKTGQGGSKLAAWVEGSTYLTTFRSRINAAKALLKTAGLIPQFYVWHSHGINDHIAASPLTPAAFKTEMKNLHTLIRKELGFVPIVMSELMPAYETYNVPIRELTTEVAGNFIVESTDLTLADSAHWDSAGMKTMAYRMGDISRSWGEHEGYALGQNKALFFGGTVADVTAPSAVTGLTAGTATATTVPLSWTAATDNVGIAGYEYSTNGTNYTSTGSTGTTYTVTGLTPATAYTLYVRAFDAAGNKGAAVSVASTTAAADALPVTDTFTGAAVEITAHTPDAGGVWTKQQGVASLALDGAGVAVSTANSSAWSIWRNGVTPATADYKAAVDITPGATGSTADNEAGPAIRASGTNNFIILTQIVGQKLVIAQSVNGSISLLAQPAFTYDPATTYRFILSAVGTAVTGKVQRLTDSLWYVAGAWQATEGAAATGTTTLTSVGAPGIGTAISGTVGANNTKFDNYSATV